MLIVRSKYMQDIRIFTITDVENTKILPKTMIST